MPKKSIKISIPAPCPKSINKMDRTGKGYFCNACQTEVLDYRNVSDTVLAKSLKDRKESGVKPSEVYFKLSLDRSTAEPRLRIKK